MVWGRAQSLNLAADSKTPGADLEIVLYLRNVADADKLIEAFRALKEKKENGKVGLHPPPPPGAISMPLLVLLPSFFLQGCLSQFVLVSKHFWWGLLHQRVSSWDLAILVGVLATWEGRDGLHVCFALGKQAGTKAVLLQTDCSSKDTCQWWNVQKYGEKTR